MEPWPLESTKRSRLGHLGLAGLWRRTSFHSTSAISAMPMGAPGWPLLACWTASILRARMALARSRRAGMGVTLLENGANGAPGDGPPGEKGGHFPPAGLLSK